MRLKTLLAALLALALLIPAGARAYTPRHGKPCHHGYSKRFKLVKSGKRRHRVRICVKRKQAASLAPNPSSAAKTKLHAHLDPTYTRDPLDPFKITYSFSASATQEAFGGAAALGATVPAVEEPAPLPSGVLALYSDGNLECAVNVGGSSTGSECPVQYPALGSHTVTTIYSSGEESATETETEVIEPLATSTTLSVSYKERENPVLRREFMGHWFAWELGVLDASSHVEPPNIKPSFGCTGVSISGTSACATALDREVVTVYGITESSCEPISYVQLGQSAPVWGGSAQELPTEWVAESPSFGRAVAKGAGYTSSEAMSTLEFGKPEVTYGC